MANDDTQETPTRDLAADLAAMVKGDKDTLIAYGLSWSVEPVYKSPGGNAASKVLVTNDAQILTIDSVPAFRENFPLADEILGGIANGTSLRVMSQDVNRRSPKDPVESRRAAILNRLQGVRNQGGRTVQIVEKIVEKKVFSLPNGQTYAGTVLVEYQQLYAGALVDLGVPNAKAIEIAKAQTL